VSKQSIVSVSDLAKIISAKNQKDAVADGRIYMLYNISYYHTIKIYQKNSTSSR